MHRLALATTLFILCAAAFAQTVTLQSLLREMTDRAAPARLPDPWFDCAQASSYDRASTTSDAGESWFANADYGQFVREDSRNGRSEWVLMDVDGPGAIVRFWSANPKGVVRIYLDGSDTPVIERRLDELLTGRASIADVPIAQPLSAERSRGCNLYLPIPYAKHCLVTCDEPGFYYQINYRTYAPGTVVESLTPDAVVSSAALIDETSRTLNSHVMDSLRMTHELSGVIPPGGTVEQPLPAGPGAVTTLGMAINLEDRDALRSLVIEIEFDSERTVWCPAGDFFGSGPLPNAVDTWWLGADPQVSNFAARWVMPYERSGVIRLHNLGDTTLPVIGFIDVEPWNWDERSLHFHAAWRQESPIHTRPMKDWNFLEVTGRGVYVGDALSVSNPVVEWWGEGDEKIYIDGQPFPSHFGTGTEDYYGYAWCCPEPFQGPFHAQPRCDGPGNFGHTTILRTRQLDTIPFNFSLKVDMEVWHWAECDIAYAATTFFYARPGATTNRPPAPEEARRGVIDPPPLPPPFRIEGVMECEDLRVVAHAEGLSVVRQDVSSFARDRWSANTHLWIQGRTVGDYVELAIPCDVVSDLAIYATKSWDYAIVAFSANAVPLAGPIDLFSGGQGRCEPTGEIQLGRVTPVDGVVHLRVEVVGSNPASLGSRAFFGLDALRLTPAEH